MLRLTACSLVASLALGACLALALGYPATAPWQGPPPASAEDVKNPFEGDSAAIERGLDLFNERCSFCHGSRGHGAKGPCLTCGRFVYRGGTNAQLFATITGGIPGGQMGAFASTIRGDDIWKIIAFIRDETRRHTAGRNTGEK